MISIGFVRENAGWLAAGALLSLGSSFGQTFFISLFAGDIRSDFGLTNGEWGGVYTIATTLSALALVIVGKATDRFRIKVIALAVIFGFALVCLSMAGAHATPVLVAVVCGLRFCGQGMMTHISMTAMGRWFRARRGQAVAIAALGFSVGEASLPAIVNELRGVMDWRTIWVLISALLVFVFAPTIYWLLRRERTPQSLAEESESTGLGGIHRSRAEALKDSLFWMLIPGFLSAPFIGTAIFFHMIHITETKGWDFSVIAYSYPFYSTAAVTVSLLAGLMVDRWRALALLPFYPLPMALSLCLIYVGEAPVFLALALGTLGVTTGLGIAVLGSVWAEIYGTRHLGSIRSLAASALVLATAFGPGVTGALIDAGIAFDQQCLMMALYCIGAAVLFTLATWRADVRAA